MGSCRQVSQTPFKEGYWRIHANFLATIEACLNSRPLAALHDDPNDPVALTSSHFVIDIPMMSLPEESTIRAGHIRNWKLLNQMRDNFRARWKRDYLQDLQTRNKWRKPNANLKVGSIVLILSENTPPTQWPLALVK